MSEAPRKKVDVTPDKTVLRALSQGGLLGGTGEVMVDVKDGRIVRIRPFQYDWKYDSATFRPWKMERNGHVLEPGTRSRPAPYMTAYKKRTYSPNRVKYPLKRVDWDPNGERNPQNRGKSKYVRISWDEATDIVASEIRRIQKTYGLNAILLQADGHGESKTIHTPHGHNGRLMDVMGGFTLQVRQPDSWEGWYWGSKHVWGHGFQGMMAPQLNVLKDIVDHSDLVLKWGCDDETTPWGFTGQNATNLSYFFTEGRHQAGLHLPRAELRRGGPRRQVDPHPPQHRRGPAAGHHLRLAQGRHVGQGVRRDPRRRHGQGRRLRARRGGRRAQDPGVGLQEDHHPRVDDQGARARVRRSTRPRSSTTSAAR